ncbi:MAG: hypothetical protein P8Y02_08440 [Deinococcales bacterium]
MGEGTPVGDGRHQGEQESGRPHAQQGGTLLGPERGRRDRAGVGFEQREPPGPPGESVGEKGVERTGPAAAPRGGIDGEPAQDQQLQREHRLLPAGQPAVGLQASHQSGRDEAHAGAVRQRDERQREALEPGGEPCPGGGSEGLGQRAREGRDQERDHHGADHPQQDARTHQHQRVAPHQPGAERDQREQAGGEQRVGEDGIVPGGVQ